MSRVKNSEDLGTHGQNRQNSKRNRSGLAPVSGMDFGNNMARFCWMVEKFAEGEPWKCIVVLGMLSMSH